MGKRSVESTQQALDELCARLQEESATLVETAVRAWAAAAVMTVEEWAEHWQPRVDIEFRPDAAAYSARAEGAPSRIVITVRAESRKGANPDGR